MKALIQFGSITHEQIRQYAEASQDFNPIHLDREFAQSAGLPEVIAHGMLSMGLASRALEEWGYDLSKLKSFSSKFKDKVFAGEELYAEFIDERQESTGLVVQWKLRKADNVDILIAEALFRNQRFEKVSMR